MRLAIAAVAGLLLAACSPPAPGKAGARDDGATDRVGEARAGTPAAKPALTLLTSLPILFGERFGLEPPASPLRDALEERFVLTAFNGPENLPTGGMLLAIQPQALTAERLVALDEWVRSGGRVLLLADARLEFESSRPLGDTFRPPFAFPDTGLLRHWGLTLAPAQELGEERAAADLGGGVRLESAGVGRLAPAGPGCRVVPGGAAARCTVGRGRAIVVADADFAMADDEAGRGAVLALLDELAAR